MVSEKKGKQAALLRYVLSLEISLDKTLKLSFSDLACSETDEEEGSTSIASFEISPERRKTMAPFLSYCGLAKRSA